MTNKEFSLEFDILFNNIMSGIAPGINDYEKSVFLTKGQEEIIKNYLNPLGNKYAEGLDDSKKRFTDFSGLIKTEEISTFITPNASIDRRAVNFALPTDAFVLLNEVLQGTDKESNTRDFQIIPISYLEYTRLMSRPYKEPLKGQAWKITTEGSTEAHSTIIPNSAITSSKYIVRYIKRPNPIILRDLSEIEFEEGLEDNFLSINNIRVKTECELNPEIHREILDRAVELAKVSYIDNSTALTQINTRNE